MPETPTTDAAVVESPAPVAPSSETDALVEESLVEEVSIDGMCGVY